MSLRGSVESGTQALNQRTRGLFALPERSIEDAQHTRRGGVLDGRSLGIVSLGHGE